MLKKDLITHEIDRLPDPVLDEILVYIQFLKQKLSGGAMETVLLSESALKKDWLRPEEDAAWQDL